MQDVGNKEDTELSREDLTLSLAELAVEFLGHCQSVGNWMFIFSREKAFHHVHQGGLSTIWNPYL